MTVFTKLTKISVPTDKNNLLKTAVDYVNSNIELQTYWNVINVNAINRRGMTDHGPVHFQIVANVALRISRILKNKGVVFSIEKDFSLDYRHAELVIFLACLLHDMGMSIDRDGHEEYSLFLANAYLQKALDYLGIEKRVIVTSEILHAIISHRSDGRPKTIEAGIVRVADALDMNKGRSRIPYEKGIIDIHSVSAAAIDTIEINENKKEGASVIIKILMNNSSGIFQIDELLKSKIKGSGIEKHIKVEAIIPTVTEKKLIKRFEFSEK